MAFIVAGTILIDGEPAVDGADVEIWAFDGAGDADLVATVQIAGGEGRFTAVVPDNTRDYRALYDDGTHRGVSALDVPETTLGLVAILGQSNANGRADTDDITDVDVETEMETAYPAVQLKQRRAASAADPIVWVTYATDDLQPRGDHATENFGVELSMGRYLDRASPNGFALVKMSVGSSGLADHWDDDSLYPALSPPNLFSQAVEYLQAAETELGGPIVAIVWIQGETDALDATDAGNYEANLTEFIAALRTTWPGVPFVFNKLHNGIDAVFTEKAPIRAAQVAVAGAVANTALVDLDDLTLKGDNTHFSADMQVEAGYRLGAAVLDLLGINVPPVAEFSYVADGLDVDFTDESIDDDGSIAAWDWDFGDGSAHGTTQNPSHSYAANGVYPVRLTVTDNDGGTHFVEHDVAAIAATWFVDGSSGKGAPEDDTEWNALITDNALSSWDPPDEGFLLQDAAGNPVGYNGLVTLTANAAPLYQQAVAGWDLLAVGTADGTANQRFRSTEAALPNVTSESFLALIYVAITNNPGAVRGIAGLGAGGIEFRAATGGAGSALARAVAGSTVTSANSHGAGVRPVWLLVNRTTNEVRLYNDMEKLSPAFGAPAGEHLDLGATIGASPAASLYLRLYLWFGAKAERSDQDIRDMTEALGWAVSGYGS